MLSEVEEQIFLYEIKKMKMELEESNDYTLKKRILQDILELYTVLDKD
ncbi:hypothetical protein JSY36_17305 [Bacillus sp. H-16]|nr:hypothetical protein [Alteribacter salitolerans]MBM7097494.1 hypothetical protein [Alteribacter salitolerans]